MGTQNEVGGCLERRGAKIFFHILRLHKIWGKSELNYRNLRRRRQVNRDVKCVSITSLVVSILIPSKNQEAKKKQKNCTYIHAESRRKLKMRIQIKL